MNTETTTRKIVKAILDTLQEEPAWDQFESGLDVRDTTLASVKKKLVVVTKDILDQAVS